MTTTLSSSRTADCTGKREVAERTLWKMLFADQLANTSGTDEIECLFGSGLLSFRSLATSPAETGYGILKRGVPCSSLAALSDYLGVGRGDVAALVDLDRTTAFRISKTDRPLPMHAGETVLRLLELTSLAEDTFESPEVATEWLRRAHPMLNGETPLELAKSGYGAERVKEILIALKYGGAV